MRTCSLIRTFVTGRGLVILALVAAGVVAITGEVEAAYGPDVPRLEAAYAAREVAPGGVWKIYLKGSDSNGDLRFIHIWVMVPWGSTTPSRLIIDGDQASMVSGYLTLHSNDFGDFGRYLFGPPIYLLVTLEDRSGNRSETVEFRASFINGVRQPAPDRDFGESFLGRITVPFMVPGGGGP